MQVQEDVCSLVPAGLNIDYYPPILYRVMEHFTTLIMSAMSTWWSGIFLNIGDSVLDDAELKQMKSQLGIVMLS